jgi:hypothetical protein
MCQGAAVVKTAVFFPIGFARAGNIAMLFTGRPCMQFTEQVQCPYCGQCSELEFDTTIPNQRFTTDCEVCCRPFEVAVQCEGGEVMALDVYTA